MKFEKSAQFKKDFRRMKKRGADFSKLEKVLEILLDGKALPSIYLDHMLISGEFKGSHDVHIAPDWLLIYDIQGDTVILERMGTHSDLF